MTSGSRFNLSAIVLLGVLLAGLLAIPAAAQAPVPQRPARRAAMTALLRGPFRPVAMELRGLQLTPAQRQQVLGIFKTQQPQMRALAERTRAAHTRWQQSGQINIAERKGLLAERQELIKAVRMQALGVLTPEQQKQLEARRRLPRRR